MLRIQAWLWLNSDHADAKTFLFHFSFNDNRSHVPLFVITGACHPGTVVNACLKFTHRLSTLEPLRTSILVVGIQESQLTPFKRSSQKLAGL